MAEIAASIIGIATFGIKLTETLYEFGKNAASAKEHMDYIARHVNLYASTLYLLADRLKDEADESFISKSAFDLVEELYDQSDELFTKIKRMLPKRRDEKDDLSFLQKIAWNFKKSAIDRLVCEINYLKSTVSLIVTIIFTGKNIRSYRKRKKRLSKDKVKVEGEALKNQFVKARNAIVEHITAGEELSNLPEEADTPLTDAIQGAPIKERDNTAEAEHAIVLVSKQNEVISAFRSRLTTVQDPSERRVIVMQSLPQILYDLVRQWTTLEVSDYENSQDAARERREPSSLRKQNLEIDLKIRPSPDRGPPDPPRSEDGRDYIKPLLNEGDRADFEAGSIYGGARRQAYAQEKESRPSFPSISRPSIPKPRVRHQEMFSKSANSPSPSRTPLEPSNAKTKIQRDYSKSWDTWVPAPDVEPDSDNYLSVENESRGATNRSIWGDEHAVRKERRSETRKQADGSKHRTPYVESESEVDSEVEITAANLSKLDHSSATAIDPGTHAEFGSEVDSEDERFVGNRRVSGKKGKSRVEPPDLRTDDPSRYRDQDSDYGDERFIKTKFHSARSAAEYIAKSSGKQPAISDRRRQNHERIPTRRSHPPPEPLPGAEYNRRSSNDHRSSNPLKLSNMTVDEMVYPPRHAIPSPYDISSGNQQHPLPRASTMDPRTETVPPITRDHSNRRTQIPKSIAHPKALADLGYYFEESGDKGQYYMIPYESLTDAQLELIAERSNECFRRGEGRGY